MTPYPRHLVRFPEALALPVTGGRKHRTPSLFSSIRHPLVALIVFVVVLALALVPVAWFLAVTAGWALWVAAVTAWWLVTAPFGRSPHGRQR